MITAAGVSSGIDMALTLAAHIAGEELAQAIQLGIEYDPEPPFDSGLDREGVARDRSSCHAATSTARLARVERDHHRRVVGQRAAVERPRPSPATRSPRTNTWSTRAAARIVEPVERQAGGC